MIDRKMKLGTVVEKVTEIIHVHILQIFQF